MGHYALKRFLALLLILWGVLTLLFLLLHAMPGDASNYFFNPEMSGDLNAQMRESLGLDQALIVQYWKWLKNAATLDFQYSFITRRPVLSMIGDALPRTLLLAGVSLVFAYALGISAGVFAARRSGGFWDRFLVGSSLFLVSLPAFLLGFFLIFLLAVTFPLFPISGTSSVNADLWPVWTQILDSLWHLFLPALTLGVAMAAYIVPFTREGLVDAASQDFVRTARAKGIPEMTVFRRHALRGALLPLLTLLGITLPMLFNGSVVVETLFGWYGMGSLLNQAILQRDIPVVLGTVFFLTLLAILGSFIADLLYRIADPRIREA